MEFEYDPQKGDGNLARHGISFEEATLLWSDPDRLEAPAKTVDEARYAMKAEEFDRLFDEGEDIVEHLDLTSASRPGRQSKRVNVDFP